MSTKAKTAKKRWRRGEQLRTRIATSGLQLDDPCRLLRARDLSLLLTVHELTIWAWVRDGKLPKPIKFSSNTKAWRAIDIADWLAAKAQSSAEA